MLYDRWRNIVKEFGKAPALADASDGRTWTFIELDQKAACCQAEEAIIFPQTNCPEFVLNVLRAWRNGTVVCPLEPGQAPPRLPGLPPAGISHLKTTSATSGRPRLVAFTEEQLAADADNLVPTMGLRPDWPNLGAISLAHSYGFSNLVLPLLLHGIPLILLRAALPEALKRAISSKEAVTVAGVPALWRMWNDAGVISPKIRLAISAGAQLSISLELAVHGRYDVKIHNFYGSSECGGIAYDQTGIPRSDGSCVGSPVSNVTVKTSEAGSIRVYGAAVGECYWPEPEDRLTGRVFQTSDLGQLKGGLLHLDGRVGDLINVAGRKVSPELIEQTLAAHPAVRECLAFGIPLEEGHRGEAIVGCISAYPGTSGEDLRQFASMKLQAWQVPREWWFVDSLQANERGKISRAEWRERYMSRHLTQRPD